jgi:rfaE bifunctional protein kinase chain/domain
MLTTAVLENILASIPTLTIGVLGDLFLDRYLDLDAALTEPSLETGLDAYQVVGVRSYPGAAGTVINNLAALGAWRVVPISVIGDDGEGFELRQALKKMPSVRLENLVGAGERRTPTYTKPMLCRDGEMPRELNRLDIKNRQALPMTVEAGILEHLTQMWPSFNVLLVLDQVSEPDCGVVTKRVRARVADLAARDSTKIVIADSRERIGLFRNVWLKPNERESLRAVGESGEVSGAIVTLSQRTQRPVFCTRGASGMLVAEPGRTTPTHVPGFPVAGPVDTVGAGDSSSAALACGLASGASLTEAAAFGNLIASITIQQIGTTGTASPTQIRARWNEVDQAF